MLHTRRYNVPSSSTYVILTLRAFVHRQAQSSSPPLTRPGALASLPCILWPLPPRFALAIAPWVNALFSRTDADKDTERSGWAVLCTLAFLGFATDAQRPSARRAHAVDDAHPSLPLTLVKHRSPSLLALTHLAHSLPPLSPLHAALPSELYGDDTDASRSTASHLACGLPFTPRCVWTGTGYGPAPTTYDDAHWQSQSQEMRTRRTRCRACVDVDEDGARTAGAGAVDEEVAGLERQMETSPSTSAALKLEAESEARMRSRGSGGGDVRTVSFTRARTRGRRWSEKAHRTYCFDPLNGAINE
ncbi:hypothetical protein B0H13DRAFT_2413868 [Mycena leptocephala]|nr:hypothetical protein B0H13DRAFT_2413868 [Mycena leptocephala]